jgi:RND family efflux transporter MFP subunit
MPIGLALLALFLLVSCTQAVDEAPTPTPFPTQAALAKPTYTVARGEVVEIAEFTGRIVPVVEQVFYFPVNGRIRKLYIQKGDFVTAGQVVADLEGIDDLERQQALRELNMQRAVINAHNASLALDVFTKTVSIYSRDYPEQLQMKQNSLLLAELAVQEAALGLEDLRSVISDTQLLAPMDGIVTAISTAEGREVEAYKPIGSVADLDEIEVRVTITGQDLAKLAEGMAVRIEASRSSGQEIAGTIRVLPSSTLSSEGDDGMRITFDPVADGYKIGDLVHVRIILRQKADALWLPPQAIRTYEGRKFVVIQDGDVQRRVDVKLGLIGEERVEILEGLEKGQTVISP